MTTIQAGIDQFLDHRRAKGVAVASRALYTRVLGRWRDWHAANGHGVLLADVDIGPLRAFFVYLREDHQIHDGNVYGPKAARVGYAPSSIETYYRVLRAFWRFLDAEELLTPTQARFFARDRIPRPKVPKRLRPAADDTLVDRLLRGIAEDDDSEHAALLRVTILLLYESGLRVSELCRLSDGDLAIRDRAARVIGKGDTERWVFWGDRAHAALVRYLQRRSGPIGATLLRGCSHRNSGGPLTRDAVRAMLKRHARASGVRLPKSAPVHCFRHGFVHAALDAGLDLSEVAQLAGHASVATTMIYAGRNKQRLQRSHRKVFRRVPPGDERRVND